MQCWKSCTCSCSNIYCICCWKQKAHLFCKLQLFLSRFYFHSMFILCFATIRICYWKSPNFLMAITLTVRGRGRVRSKVCCNCAALSRLSLGMLWSSFHRRRKGIPLKPLSQICIRNNDSIQEHQPKKWVAMSCWPRTQTHVMTSNKTCLESDQLLLLGTKDQGLSFSFRLMQYVERRSGWHFT